MSKPNTIQPELPDVITKDSMLEALHALGIPSRRLTSAVIEPGSVHLTYLNVDGHGELILDRRNQYQLTTYHIPLQ